MKVCPQCRAEHEDFMNFCMKDGTPLVAAVSPTETPTESFDYENDSVSQPIGSQREEIPRVMPTETQTEQYSTESQTEEYEQETFVRPSAPDAGEPTGQSQIPPASRQEVRAYQPKKSNVGIILGVLLLGVLLLFGAAIGGGLWWYLSSDSGNEIASANANQNDNSISDGNENGDNSSNENSLDLFGDNSDTNENSNKKETPTPTKTPTPTPTKTPTPTPTKTPTPTPDDEETPTPVDKNTPNPTPTPPPPTPPPAPKTIAGGVVNGKATSLPKPAYPASARAVGAKGAVNVQVLIDERGNVVSASAISGHPLLRGPATTAARRAKFAPTQLSGQPVKVSGVITYVFN